MDTAIIIGFEYTKSNNTSLCGCTLDMYRAYRYAKDMNVNNIYILSDMVSYTPNKRVYMKYGNAIDEFIPSMEGVNWNYVDSIDSMCTYVDKIETGRKIMVYYTGHASTLENNIPCIELPSNEKLPFVMFRDIILNKIHPDSQILWIMDCCKAGGFLLPYTLNNNSFVLTNEDSFVYHDIICFVSSEISQISIASEEYSYFTKYLFENLEKGIISLAKIQENILLSLGVRINQVCSVYSSYIRPACLWLWALKIDMDISIYSDHILLNSRCHI